MGLPQFLDTGFYGGKAGEGPLFPCQVVRPQMPGIPQWRSCRPVVRMQFGRGERSQFHQPLRRRPGRRELWMATWGALLLVYGLYKFAALNG